MTPTAIVLLAWLSAVTGFAIGLVWAGAFPKCDDGLEDECCGGKCKRPGARS